MEAWNLDDGSLVDVPAPRLMSPPRREHAGLTGNPPPVPSGDDIAAAFLSMTRGPDETPTVMVELVQVPRTPFWNVALALLVCTVALAVISGLVYLAARL